jgi:putative proteasome-type protease
VTFCLGMKVESGLVGIADTRVTTGSEVIQARKVTVYDHGGHSFFLMTSGLRSVRDKALTYFQEHLDEGTTELDRLYKAVNLFAEQVRRVAEEDRTFLEASSLTFNLFSIMGGRLEHDRDHKLYLLYPQGNWIDVGPGTPYSIIGESGYGKPILDRTLRYEDEMAFALKVGCLAFDSTRISSSTVDFPIDVVLFSNHTGRIHQHRYEKRDLTEFSELWQTRLREAVNDVPSTWLNDAFPPSEEHESIPLKSVDTG